MRVLITGARMWYAINAIRLLARNGHDVFAADSSKFSGGLYSRYLKGKFVYPSVSDDSEGFINEILEKTDEMKIDVIFPTFEEGFVISKYLHLFEGRVKVLVPSYDHIKLLHDKFTMTDYARSLGICVPRTALLGEFEPNGSSFPLIVKPRNQRSAEGIVRVTSSKEFEKISKALDGKRFLVQEWKPPHQICTTGLAYNGKMIGNVIYKNVREYPESGGIGTCRISIECDSVLRDVEKIVGNLNYSGFISTDFLYDKERDAYFLVDVNPRMSPGLLVAYCSGVDMVKAYMDLVTKNRAEQIMSPEVGNGTYTTAMEIGWFFSVLFKGRFGKMKGFFKSRKRLRDDSWDIRDPAPFFVMLMSMLYTAILGPLKGGQTKSFSLGATCDIESLCEEADSNEVRKAV
ncbi:MAG TPA: ATP-utilizing protein [Mesotoga sp.]|nr:ATP-utilizing protein [Mesotoga sp.]